MAPPRLRLGRSVARHTLPWFFDLRFRAHSPAPRPCTSARAKSRSPVLQGRFVQASEIRKPDLHLVVPIWERAREKSSNSRRQSNPVTRFSRGGYGLTVREELVTYFWSSPPVGKSPVRRLPGCNGGLSFFESPPLEGIASADFRLSLEGSRHNF